jgi:hypothetical protein
MQKIFCDACNHEVKENRMIWEPMVHIVDYMEGNSSGYVDLEFNPVSGRKECYDICLGCYNAIQFEAYRVFQTIKEVVTK